MKSPIYFHRFLHPDLHGIEDRPKSVIIKGAADEENRPPTWFRDRAERQVAHPSPFGNDCLSSSLTGGVLRSETRY